MTILVCPECKGRVVIDPPEEWDYGGIRITECSPDVHIVTYLVRVGKTVKLRGN
jgi:uncharacterized protein YbaR (Trm112 family)